MSEWSPIERVRVWRRFARGGSRFVEVDDTGSAPYPWRALRQRGDGLCVEVAIGEAQSLDDAQRAALAAAEAELRGEP